MTVAGIDLMAPGLFAPLEDPGGTIGEINVNPGLRHHYLTSDPPKQVLPAAGAKGFGLVLMVEVLSRVLTGAGVSKQVNSLYKDFEHSGQSGQIFVRSTYRAEWITSTFSTGWTCCMRLARNGRTHSI